jgi:hypothetical protein
VPLWFDAPGPDFVIAGPDLLPGLPATPAPLLPPFVLDCANAIDEASIVTSTIAIILRIAFPPRFQCDVWHGIAVYLGNEVGLPSFLQCGH